MAYYDVEMIEEAPPSTCTKVCCCIWKTVTFIISHVALISLVISYCVAGAYMFEHLEQKHEKDVKSRIKNIRLNITDHLWNATKYEIPVLEKENYTNMAIAYLKDFEFALLDAINKEGWDGSENHTEINWTFQGSLFYSIIVITTIGYGHIAPKTDLGKVATIFYAIVGIPLMLLCLSNVGDILATSFRFLYWKVCCYMCTKKPKKRRNRSRATSRSVGRTRSRTASFRRSVRTSTRSATTDSGFGFSDIMPSSYSDTDLSRYHDEYPRLTARSAPIPKVRLSQQSRYSDSTVSKRRTPNNRQPRGGSLDRRREVKNLENTLEPIIMANADVLCNKYVVNQREQQVNHVPDGRRERNRRPPSPEARRALSMPRSHYLELPHELPPNEPRRREPPRGPPVRESHRELSPGQSMDSVKVSLRRKKPPTYTSSPRIMSPMGFVSRQNYADEESDYDYYEDDDYYDMNSMRTRPVPIWLCVLLVLSYIIAGMFLFNSWEGWQYLDAAYFCFITLTTIGFGDFVPKSDQNISIALCSLYLLFGISLLAMSFNLVQEEVLAHVRKIAKTLGIIKSEDSEEEEDD